MSQFQNEVTNAEVAVCLDGIAGAPRKQVQQEVAELDKKVNDAIESGTLSDEDKAFAEQAKQEIEGSLTDCANAQPE